MVIIPILEQLLEGIFAHDVETLATVGRRILGGVYSYLLEDRLLDREMAMEAGENADALTGCMLVATVEVIEGIGLTIPPEHRLLLPLCVPLHDTPLTLSLLDVPQAMTDLPIQQLSVTLYLLECLQEAVLAASEVVAFTLGDILTVAGSFG